MRTLPPLILFLFFTNALFSQFGKDGLLTINSGTTVVNHYASISGSISIGQNTITVTSMTDLNLPSALTCGDLLMIYQAQGADMNISDSPLYGNITNYNSAGLFEYRHVASVNGNTITLNAPLNNNYTLRGHPQIVKIPQYTKLTINMGAIVTGLSWDGSKGGIVSIHCTDSLIVNGQIKADNLGFRGGKTRLTSEYAYSIASYVSSVIGYGGEKGEGICGNSAEYVGYGGSFCRGAPGNGGGGGQGNSGGGGGANASNSNAYNGAGVMCSVCTGSSAWTMDADYIANGNTLTNSSGGGKGGNSGAGYNANALVDAPGSAAWGSDRWRNVGGRGGKPVTNINITGRIYFGGGGGAGDANNNAGSNGGNGGGVIYIITPEVAGTGSVSANGNKSAGSHGTHDDGQSGGGGGGSIVMNCNTVSSSTSLSATGGEGGSIIANTVYLTGPGGGGSGGFISKPAGSSPSITVSGGKSGINLFSWISEWPVNGATDGAAGFSESSPTFTLVSNVNFSPSGAIGISSVSANTICAGQTVTIVPTGSSNYSLSPGNISGTNFTVTPSTSTTYTIYSQGSCAFSYTTLTINVTPFLFNTTSDQTICSGQTATLSASGAINYTWQPNNLTTSSITVSPTTASIYTVIGSNGFCNTTQTVSVNVLSSPDLVVNNPSVCPGASATLSVSGASNYTWTPAGSGNANMPTLVVTPGSTSTFSVTGSNSVCSSSTTATVYVFPPPSIILPTPVQAICAGSTATLTASGATTYSWTNSGSLSASLTVSPSTTTAYTVTGFSNEGCMSTPLSGTITILPLPILSVTGNTTLCLGETTTLIATGANTYTWANSGSSSASLTISPPATTIYTLTGTSANGCSNTEYTPVPVAYYTAAVASIEKTDTCSGNIRFKCSTNPLYNVWNFSNGESVVNTCNFSYQFPNAGNYVLTYITNPNTSCADTLITSFSISGTLTATKETPNVFTPNNDDINDVFDFSGITGCKTFGLEIYNRWGTLILSSSHQRFWDGRTTSGEPVSEGTYFYILKTSDGSFKGTVTLFR